MKRSVYMVVVVALVVFLSGCSRMNYDHICEDMKYASYQAVSDPVTWGSALGATLLYTTGADEHLTDYFMEHHWVDGSKDDLIREANGAIAYGSAFLAHDGNWTTTLQRGAITFTAFGIARATANSLENNIQKTTPDGRHTYAIGSHHALEPFTGAALTRRFTEGYETLPLWSRYGIIGANYCIASYSALSRVQEGGHSFADQLVSAAIGNFIGLYSYDAATWKVLFNVSPSKEYAYMGVSIPF